VSSSSFPIMYRSNTRLSGWSALSPAGVTWCWLACRVLLKTVYVLTCRVLGLAVVVFRSDLAKEAELLVLRHENAVLRRHGGGVRYESADRAWFAVLARLVPRRRWAGGLSRDVWLNTRCITIRPGRTRASPSSSPTANTTMAASPLPTSTADGSSENRSWEA